MIKLENFSYEEFGKLRFLDYFPRTESYYNDDVGGTTCSIGYGAVDGYGFTGFVSPASEVGQTSEISIDFKKDCPKPEGEAFLQFLGLNLQKGMSREKIKSLLEKFQASETSLAEFVIGSSWPYYLSCRIDVQHGLDKVWICRKDLADKEAENLERI